MNIVCFGDSNTYGYDPRGYFGERYAADSRRGGHPGCKYWLACLQHGTEWPGDSLLRLSLSCRHESTDRHAGNQQSATKKKPGVGRPTTGIAMAASILGKVIHTAANFAGTRRRTPVRRTNSTSPIQSIRPEALPAEVSSGPFYFFLQLQKFIFLWLRLDAACQPFVG